MVPSQKTPKLDGVISVGQCVRTKASGSWLGIGTHGMHSEIHRQGIGTHGMHSEIHRQGIGTHGMHSGRERYENQN